MTELLVSLLMWVCAIGSGLVAGVFFAFSTFIMTALAQLPPASGAAAMQAINRVILGTLFLPVFFGSTLASVVLAVIAFLRWDASCARALLAAGILYVVGVFVCTIARNVPLNNALARADVTAPETPDIWAHYLRQWTFWNHLRTAASAAACVLYIAAIALGAFRSIA